MSETLIIFLCFTKRMQSYGVIAKQIERKTITLHEIRNVQTLIGIQEQTCFSVFAGLQVLYLNLTLASWLFQRVPTCWCRWL